MDDRCIIYRIDKSKTIIHVSANWDQFAMENKEDQLVRETVLNKPLFSYIKNWECRHLYEMLIDRVSRTGVTIKFPYRCDSPGTRRYMNMEIVPKDNELIEFKSYIVKEELRERQPLLDIGTDRSREFVVICSWCKKINTAGDQWEEVEDAVTSMTLFASPVLPDLSHGICPPCYQDLCDKFSS
ncbi:MAG: hypothetical protein PVJ39_00950 [Gammaproteobacteria bacterium]|jgi:hypothetical protein